MNTFLDQTMNHYWNLYIKSFLIAIMLGILAGATLGSLAHAEPCQTRPSAR